MTPPTPSDSLPPINSPHTSQEVVRRLESAAKKGRLPGFEAGGKGGELFSVDAFGQMMDYRLCAAAGPSALGTKIAFTLRAVRKVHMILAVMLIVTIWPGMWMTDSMIRSWFTGYTYPTYVTWAWYIPLAILPIPWMWWSGQKKSLAAAKVHAQEQIAKIAAEVEGSVANIA